VRATESKHQTRYHACFALSMTCAVGIAFAANLFTLFVFYELMTLCTYPLVAHAGTQRAREGGRRYLTYLLGTSLSLLFAAIALTWSLAGTLDFRAGGTIGADLPTGVLVLLLGLFAFGFGKAALMPLHAWLPAAMVAPTPVSALLHAVAVVKAGVFAITKVIVFVLGTDTLAATGASDWLVAVAAAGLVLSGWIALRQDELKRRLAYSTVSQLAYVTLAAALATPLAVVGAAVQVAAHAVGKITLFFAAGSIQVATGRTKVSQLDGIARRMPITMTAFAIGSLSIIGLPPAAGLVGKWFILRGAFEADEPLAVAALAVGTLLSIGYLVPILQAAFLREERVAAIETEVRVQEAPWPMTVAVGVTALLTVLLFLFPGPLLDIAALIAGPAAAAVAAGGAP
jgi:multicomponent Na+:H+ antiporter subunit D